MGPTDIVQDYLASTIGKGAEGLRLNSKLSKPRREELNSLTRAQGLIAGWAYGVAGSNDFAVEHEGTRRFLRSAIVLGNPVPNLLNFADAYRGLFAGHHRLVEEDVPDVGARVVGEPVLPDWGMTYRSIPFEGQVRGDEQLVAANMIGFGDPIANELLDGRYLAEFVQMAGRIRPHLPDPLDPTIEPRVYMFAGVAIPGYEVDRVIGLEELRADLGLPADPMKTRGRPSKKSPEQALRDAVKERGPGAIIRGLTARLLKDGRAADSITTGVRLIFENAGLDFGGRLVREANEAIVVQLRQLGRTAEAERLEAFCHHVRQTA
jgi:hypothetical protein